MGIWEGGGGFGCSSSTVYAGGGSLFLEFILLHGNPCARCCCCCCAPGRAKPRHHSGVKISDCKRENQEGGWEGEHPDAVPQQYMRVGVLCFWISSCFTERNVLLQHNTCDHILLRTTTHSGTTLLNNVCICRKTVSHSLFILLPSSLLSTSK